MSALIERARLLMAQERHPQAAEVLREALADDPEDAEAHALLSWCLVRAKDLPGAEAAAKSAIGLAPDSPFVHFTHALALFEGDRYDDAEGAAEAAIALDPTFADAHALVASVRMAKRQWAPALEAAEQALEQDPEHAWATNLRAQALMKLGRSAEARQTMLGSLAQHPDEALTHANQGWVLLESGDPKGALGHFEEALRLDPTLEWAREGVVTALKARHVLYRWTLAFFSWMGRLTPGQQWAVLLVGFFGSRALRGLAGDQPALAPFIWPVIGVYWVFVALTWVADPLFNLVLRLNRYGRLVLSEQERRGSTVFGGVLGAAVALGLVAWLAGPALGQGAQGTLVLAAGLTAAMLLPVSATLSAARPEVRRKMARATAILAGLAVVFLAASAAGFKTLAGLTALAGVLAFFAFQIYANRVAIHGKG